MKMNIWVMSILFIPYKLSAQLYDDTAKINYLPAVIYTDTSTTCNAVPPEQEILSYQDDEDYRQTRLPDNDLYFELTKRQAGTFRYRRHGYNNDHTDTYLNGLLMNDIENNSSFFNTGLNDAFKGNSSASFPNHTSLAGTLWQDYITTHQVSQSIVSYTHGNQLYSNRLMLAHQSNTTSKGWTYAIAMARAWMGEGYREGSFHDKYSWYMSLSKQIKQRSTLHFFTSGATGTTGQAMAATSEAYDLAGSAGYNPCWGYQNGQKRNANINRSFLPLWALRYDYHADSNTRAIVTIGYQQGYREQSSLDWYNAPDPRPDYYKNMPSYYSNEPGAQNLAMADMIRQKWLNDPAARQIDWDNLYDVNRLNIDPLNTSAGSRSAYVEGADREDIGKINIEGLWEKKFNEHVKSAAGFTFIKQRSDQYRKMLDLLGGDYYLNLNQFAEQTYALNNTMKQVDLDDPDSMVQSGDAYGYHYLAHFTQAFVWVSVVISCKNVDVSISGRSGFDSYYREGIYRNGLFPDSSKGKSAMQQFLTYRLNARVSYKIDCRQNIWLHAIMMNEAPSFNNTFISPKTRNSTVAQAETEKISSIESGYKLFTAKLEAQVSAFATDMSNRTQISRFYYEGYNSFVNYVLQHIDTRYIGIEFAVKFRLWKNFSVTGAASLIQAFYRSNPDGSLYRDNDTTTRVDTHIAYLENYNVASAPQATYILGFQYRSRKNKLQWGMSLNGAARNYVELNPIRHTEDAIAMLPRGSAQYEAILHQEVLPAAFTVDVYAGKTFRLQKISRRFFPVTLLNISCGVNNLLNRKDILISGKDQMRFDYDSQDLQRFPAKYTYAQGLNYFVRCSLEF